jgi:hypothetical protein
MGSFNLQDYARPHDSLPGVLWRVTHPNSQHKLDPTTGEMSARARSDDAISDEASLKQRVSHHFSWSSREPSCFLSVFTDEEHARNWAGCCVRNTGDFQVYITPIITAMLPATAQVFDATSLHKRLRIYHRYPEHEVMFLHRIPWQSLGFARSLEGTTTENLRFAWIHVLDVRDVNDALVVCITRVNKRRHTTIHRPIKKVLMELSKRLKGLARDYSAAIPGVVLPERPNVGGEPGQDAVRNTRKPDIELASTSTLSDTPGDKNDTTGILELADGVGGGPGLLVAHTAKDDGQPELEENGKDIPASLHGSVDEGIPDLSRLSLAED